MYALHLYFTCRLTSSRYLTFCVAAYRVIVPTTGSGLYDSMIGLRLLVVSLFRDLTWLSNATMPFLDLLTSSAWRVQGSMTLLVKRMPSQLNIVAERDPLDVRNCRVVQTSGGMFRFLLISRQRVLCPAPNGWLSGLSMLTWLLVRRCENLRAFPLMMVKTMSIRLLCILSILNGCGTSTTSLRSNRPMNRVVPVRVVTHLLWNARWNMLLDSSCILAMLMVRCLGKKLVEAVRSMILLIGAKAVVGTYLLTYAITSLRPWYDDVAMCLRCNETWRPGGAL